MPVLTVLPLLAGSLLTRTLDESSSVYGSSASRDVVGSCLALELPLIALLALLASCPQD